MKLSSLAFGVGSFKTNQFGVGDFGASGGGNSAPWYGSYLFRKKLTIDFTDVSSTLTNMPVPVFLDDSNFDFTKILTAGEDVRFVDSDQVTLLKYEKESIVRTVTDIYGSDVFTGGTGTGSTDNGGPSVANPYDANDGTFWTSLVGSGMPQWTKYDLGSGVTKTVRKISVLIRKSGDVNGVPSGYIFQGSNNDSTWTDLTTVTGESWADDGPKTYAFANSTAYRYYRLYITATATNSYVQIKTLNAYELTSSSSVNTAVFWVKIPTISAVADTDFYIYFNKAGDTDGTDRNNVWDSNHKGVWHLQESGNGTAGEYKDSTVNANNGQGSNSPVQAAGKVGFGQTFATKKILIPDHASLELAALDFTISLKVKFTSIAAFAILTRDTSGSSYFYLGSDGGNSLRFRDYIGSENFTNTQTPGFATATWYDLEITRNGSNLKYYIDNVQLGATVTISATLVDRSQGWNFGGNASINYHLQGMLDEIRISTGIDRGASWRGARIAGDNNTLLTYGSETPKP